jgi:hypothetical protein
VSTGRPSLRAEFRPRVLLSVGFTTFPEEIFKAQRSLVEKAYPNAAIMSTVWMTKS